MSFLTKRKTQWKKIQKVDAPVSYESPQRRISELKYSVNINANCGREVVFSEHLKPYLYNEIAKLYSEDKRVCYIVRVADVVFDNSLQTKNIDVYISARIAQQILLNTANTDNTSTVSIELLPLFKVPVLKKVSLYVSNCCINLKDSYILNKMLYNKLVNDQDVISTIYNDFKVELSEESGVIQGTTQLKIFSLSNFYYFFIEVSQEVFEENNYVKQLNLELYTKYFKKLVNKICGSHIYQEVKIIVYSRMFYPQFKSLEETQLNCIQQGYDFNSFQINSKGEVFKDYYDFLDICLPVEKGKVVESFKRVIFNFIRKLRWKIDCSEYYNLYSLKEETHNQFEGKLAVSSNSNFLEALNLFLSSSEIEKIKNNFNMCGIKCIIFSCGDCIYNVERYFVDLFQYTMSEEDINIYFYAFKNQARLNSVLVRYRNYTNIQVEREDIKKADDIFDKSLDIGHKESELEDINRLTMSTDSFVLNIMNAKEGILRKCIRHSHNKFYDQTINRRTCKEGNKDMCIRETDLCYIEQNYKGIINYKNNTNLLYLDNDRIIELYPQFAGILRKVFEDCGHGKHYLPFDMNKQLLEDDDNSQFLFLHEIMFLDTLSHCKPNLASFNLWSDGDSEASSPFTPPVLKSSSEIFFRRSLHENTPIYPRIFPSIKTDIFSYLKNKKNDIKGHLKNFNDAPVKPFKLKNYKKPLNDYELRLGGQGNQYTLYNLRNDSNFLDTLISNVLSKGYQLMYSNERHVMSKKETSHVISQRTSNYPKTVYTTPQKITIFNDSFVLAFSSIYKFIYHYDLLHTQEKSFLHRKIEFSQLETFPWQTIENMYYSDEYLFSDLQKIHQYFWQTRYIVYYKDFDINNKQVVDKAHQELASLIEALNAVLPTLTSVTKNKIDLTQRDRKTNYVVIESEKLMNNKMFRDEIYLIYNPATELRNYFTFKISTMFGTPIILQQLLLIIKKEINRFNLHIKKRASKKNKFINNINDTVIFELRRLTDDSHVQELKGAFLSCDRMFYPYKETGSSFSVFDKNVFLFIYINKREAAVYYNSDLKTYDENDFDVVWSTFKSLIEPYR